MPAGKEDNWALKRPYLHLHQGRVGPLLSRYGCMRCKTGASRRISTLTLLTMSRVQEYVSNKAQSALLTVLSAGPIPKHVAFCMDGNRRYARRNHKQVAQGHSDGFLALRRVRGIDLFCDAVYRGLKLLVDARNMHAIGRTLRISIRICD